MKNRGTGYNIVINIIASIIGFGISLLFTPYIVSKLGKETYAFYSIANNITSYFGILTIVLNSMASRFIILEIAKSKKNALEYYSTLLFSNIILGAVIFIFCIVFVNFSHLIFNMPVNQILNIKNLFLLVFLSFCINLISSCFTISMYVKERMDLAAVENILENILKVILYILLFSFLEPNIVYVGIIVIVIALFGFIYKMMVKQKLLPDFIAKKEYVKADCFKNMVSSGVWRSISSLGGLLINSSVILIVNIFISAKASGDIAIVQTIITILTTIMYSVSSVLFPRIANIYASQEKSEIPRYIDYYQKIQNLFVCPLFIVILIVDKAFFSLWIPFEDASWFSILSFVMLIPYILNNFIFRLQDCGVMENIVKNPSIMILLFGSISVIVSLALIYTTNLGIYSVIIPDTILTSLYYIVYTPIYLRYKFSFVINLKEFYYQLVKNIIYIIAFVLIGLYVNFNLTNWFNFILISCLLYVVCFAVYFIFFFNSSEKKMLASEFKINTDKTQL